MRNIFARSLAASFVLAAVSTAASAQVLVSADNDASTTYTSSFNQLYAVDGSNTALTFKTTKANEAVNLSFAGARCGISQTAPQSNTVLNESSVQGFFYMDGSLVAPGSGNAYTLCAYSVLPQAQYMTQWGAGHMQQRVIVPTPGLHTVGVLLQVTATEDGTSIFPVFGQSHISVSH